MTTTDPGSEPLDPGRYGRSFAEVYDHWYANSFETQAAIAALQTLAIDGPILELGVGTGRLALPLARSGLKVVGLDSSIEMLNQLMTSDVEGRVDVVLGDMANISNALNHKAFSESFTLVYCTFNTLLNLPDFDAITQCLRESRAALTPNGHLVIEAFVPIPAVDFPATSLSPARVASDAAVFIETAFDPATSLLEGRHIEVRKGEVTVRPWSVLICNPEELDQAAERAGLRLVERWSDWKSSPFDVESDTHISVYSPNNAE